MTAWGVDKFAQKGQNYTYERKNPLPQGMLNRATKWRRTNVPKVHSSHLDAAVSTANPVGVSTLSPKCQASFSVSIK
ncbi:MAG: hypothetical protein LBI04_06365 [Treponema sp.]|nr:hypothetical protein [Treponema sp.]